MSLEVTVTVNRDLLVSIIWVMGGLVLTLLGFIATVGGKFYNGMMNRFDHIELKIEPVNTTLAIHTEQIGSIRKDQEELNKWVGNHDGRIQSIERKMITT